MSETLLKIEGKPYPLPLEEVLANLTGAESLMLEDYLGGWDQFDVRGGATRSVIVLVWLAKHHAGEEMELAEIEQMRGLIFGDTVDVQEVDASPPAEDASGSSSETSVSNGAPALEPSTT